MKLLPSPLVRPLSRGVQLAALLGFACTPVLAQSLSDSEISLVTQDLAAGASHSWEYGTRSEVLLEYYAPSYSVLSNSPVPPPQHIPSDLQDALSPVLGIAQTIVANRSTSNGGITGPQPLINDAAAGDPASIGMCVILANWTGQGVKDGLDYAGAATDQLNFLFEKVPHTSDGAISHRVAQLQLWSDSVYMVPPFLAYYGVITQDQSLLEEAHTQIMLYRNYLRDPSVNLWKHIQLGVGTDPGHWSTGNAWAAAGMIRVLGTIQRSQYADALYSQQIDLANWISEIHQGMYAHLDETTGLFHTYADNSSSFLDASSTALLASSVYHLSLLWGDNTYIPKAEECRKTLSAPSSSSPSGLLHFDSNGWLTPVVNPDDWTLQGSDSPESEAFIISMQAAWKAWVAAESQGAQW